ncbi:hypothetical protein Hamer_G008045 [Homarus americanus]|uniref:Uncharacterized protein n=1 Tax=Homarus americanus TaxID=6706 RepID=A0A8J5JQV9_HOMAM|nr:hypothetical protein Hamer_G008045 [Homarus americanus]
MCNRWNDAFHEVQVEVGEKLKQLKQKLSGEITEVREELTVVNSELQKIRGGRKAQPRVEHVNRLWQYHGPWQYIWEDSEEQSHTYHRRGPDWRSWNLAMDQEEEHCSLLAELGVT